MGNYEYFYKGTPYSLSPNYGNNAEGGIQFTGYRAGAGDIGITTDARTANALQEVSNKLNTGVKVIEAGSISPEIFESIPQQHLKEINRVAKLTGSEVTVHAPVTEASGFGRENWSELQRQSAERQMIEFVTRAHDVRPNGNVPVTFHSSAALPEGVEIVKEKVDGKWREVPKAAYIIDPETGKLVAHLRDNKRYFPGEPKEFTVEAELKRINEDSWRNTITHLTFNTSRGIEHLDHSPITQEEFEQIKSGEMKFSDFPGQEANLMKSAYRDRNMGEVFLRDGYRDLREIFPKAYKAVIETQKSDDPEKKARAEQDKNALDSLYKEIDSKKELLAKNPAALKEIMEKGVEVLNKIDIPRMFKPLNEFVLEKSSQTFGNVAFEAWKKFGDSAPIVSIENPPAGGGLSRAEDLKALIEKARENFVKKAQGEGLSKHDAESAAKKLIGATWDVGHINMLRKFGYDRNDIVKQSETIAPFVKHVHLSDNFGHEHTELPMGMGNVPIKEILQKLDQEGFEGKKIVEAAAWWQHFKTPPLVPTLEAFGSPLYPMLNAPYWNQIASTYGNYLAFPSAYFPEQHFSLYGGGFSGLPQELGGQIPGKQSRVTGTPMD